ncbi:MAG: hypothetical protein EOP09_08285 [Proteobacteria bacterium]|nr:MAG: hypothetical protein EOP09_08285 [Pseudomonadota bacterium]
MSKIISVILLLSLTIAPITSTQARGRSGVTHSSSLTTHVRSYKRSNGSTVQSHERTRANLTRSDNWSTKGNVNPYTGKIGTK